MKRGGAAAEFRMSQEVRRWSFELFDCGRVSGCQTTPFSIRGTVCGLDSKSTPFQWVGSRDFTPPLSDRGE